MVSKTQSLNIEMEKQTEWMGHRWPSGLSRGGQCAWVTLRMNATLQLSATCRHTLLRVDGHYEWTVGVGTQPATTSPNFQKLIPIPSYRRNTSKKRRQRNLFGRLTGGV